MKHWRCPFCGVERSSFAKPNHKHDGAWVPFQVVNQPVEPVAVETVPEPPVRRKPGRPRKTPVE